MSGIRAGALVILLIVALAAPSGAAPAGPATTMRHSGIVVTIDPPSGRMVLEEVGPWRVVDGRTRVDQVSIEVAATTPVTGVLRVPEAPSGFRGDFAELELSLADVRPGDFVTVDCLHEGGRFVARSITIVDLEAAP